MSNRNEHQPPDGALTTQAPGLLDDARTYATSLELPGTGPRATPQTAEPLRRSCRS